MYNYNVFKYRGVEQLAARRAHNPKVVSSSLTPQPSFDHYNYNGFSDFLLLSIFTIMLKNSIVLSN